MSAAPGTTGPVTDPETTPLAALEPRHGRPTEPTEPAERADRGTLSLADTVLEKLVVASAAELAAIDTETRPGALGRPAHASVRRDGDAVEATLRTAVVYPHDLAATADAARDRIRARLGELAGLEVRRVDITVTALTDPTARRSGRVVA